jgi:hypothetical protein
MALHFLQPKNPAALPHLTCGDEPDGSDESCPGTAFVVKRTAMGTILLLCADCDEQYEFEQIEQAPTVKE